MADYSYRKYAHHVLDNTEHRTSTLEHHNAFFRIDQRDVLRVVTTTAPVTGMFCASVN